MSNSVTFPRQVELYCKPVDLRKGYNGLQGIIEYELSKDSLNGTLYLFVNRNKTIVKGIFWDRTGYILVSKKLERGNFSIPIGDEVVELNEKSFRLLLDGLNLFSKS